MTTLYESRGRIAAYRNGTQQANATHIARNDLALNLGVHVATLIRYAHDAHINATRFGPGNAAHYTVEDAERLRVVSLEHCAPLPEPTSPEGRVLAIAAAHYGVQVASLAGVDKSTYFAEARHACMMVFSKQGYSIVELSKLFRRDHSSVCHALEQAGGPRRPCSRTTDGPRMDRIQVAVQEILATLLSDPTYTPKYYLTGTSLDDILQAATRNHPAQDAVCAYVRAVVHPYRTQRIAEQRVLYSGLWALSQDGTLRGRIGAMLHSMEQPGIYHVMAHHARQLGFTWEAAS